nr:efflux RND transporter permease subunit [Paenibacillus sp. YPD9-1]
MLVDIELPTGSTFADTTDTTNAIGAWIQQQPGVKEVSSYAGRTAPKFYYTEVDKFDSRVGQVLAIVDMKKVKTEELVAAWRKGLTALYPGVQITPRELENGPPVGAPIAIRISGTDQNELKQLSNQVQQMLHEIKGAVDISDDIGNPTPTVQMVLDKDKANYFGVTDKDLSATVRLATDGIKVSDMQLDNRLIDITMYTDHSSSGQAADPL